MTENLKHWCKMFNIKTFIAFFELCAQAARLMVGVGDYPTYLAHMQAHHPDATPLSKADWFRQRQNARYGKGDGSVKRCPC